MEIRSINLNIWSISTLDTVEFEENNIRLYIYDSESQPGLFLIFGKIWASFL